MFESKESHIGKLLSQAVNDLTAARMELQSIIERASSRSDPNILAIQKVISLPDGSLAKALSITSRIKVIEQEMAKHFEYLKGKY